MEIKLQMKFAETTLDEVKIDAIKRGRGCKQKGNVYTIFSLLNN